jgi:phage FluMu protein Com
MTACGGETTSEGLRPARPVGLRGSVLGLYLTLECPGCGQAFEGYQPTVAGMAVGRHECPRCRLVTEVTPDDLETALPQFAPSRSFVEMAALTAEAAHLAENWYRTPPLDQVLGWQGLNLGEPAERWLAAFFVQGLLDTQGQGEK